MDNVAKISAQATPSVSNAVIINAMAVLCGLAVVMFACMATYGIDMSVGFF
jgi:ribose/xylose/arabinose/galactoside ABC-type transport system permease subunit